MTDAPIWVIDDDRSMRWVLEKALRSDGFPVEAYADADGVLERLDAASGDDRPAAIVTDIRMPGLDGLGLLGRLQERWPDLPVIIITAHSDLDSAVSAYEGGAFEYLPKPFDVDEAVELVRRAVATGEEATGVELAPGPLPEIIGEAPAMQEVYRAIGRLSRSHITVLINGESGTGKELVAHALHRHSPRADHPFIALNMAAIPRDLLESELFGHERGAFTGAQAARAGRFEQADGGTLFLDEIGDMPAELQTRLLRVLADGEFYRVGGRDPRRVDVRIIAATHQDLEQLVDEGRFRDDLFHRLNVIRIHLPSLRERSEDIPLLVRHFLDRAAEELEVEPKRAAPETERWLAALPWPGNVRQLENTCRWLTVMSPGQVIQVEDLPRELRDAAESGTARPADEDWTSALARWARARLARAEEGVLTEAEAELERVLVRIALEHTGGRRQEAARLLGWGRNTLTRKIRDLGMAEADPD